VEIKDLISDAQSVVEGIQSIAKQSVRQDDDPLFDPFANQLLMNEMYEAGRKIDKDREAIIPYFEKLDLSFSYNIKRSRLKQ
jgi:hypothetical protein